MNKYRLLAVQDLDIQQMFRRRRTTERADRRLKLLV